VTVVRKDQPVKLESMDQLVLMELKVLVE